MPSCDTLYSRLVQIRLISETLLKYKITSAQESIQNYTRANDQSHNSRNKDSTLKGKKMLSLRYHLNQKKEE